MTELYTFCFDLDQTLCVTPGTDYEKSEPIQERIDKVNWLYLKGNRIIIFTARGSKSGVDFSNLTSNKLKTWGLKFHELILGKPFAHFYIDDLAVHSESFDWSLADK